MFLSIGFIADRIQFANPLISCVFMYVLIHLGVRRQTEGKHCEIKRSSCLQM